jgi:thymidylate kinase
MAASSGRYQRGLFVVVLGPDGCGKSTLVGEMLHRIAAEFGHTWRFHWRPGLLPKLSRTSHSAPPAFAPPPDTAAYGYFVSLVRYLYYLSDFVLGYWFVVYPKRRRNGLVIGERWYYDVIVNPARYGFRLPLWLLRAGARFVPKPDLTLLLEADPAAIHERKPELTTEQIHYQLTRFRDLLEKIPNSLRVGTGGTLDQSLRAVSEAIRNSRTRIDPEPASNDSSWSGFPSSARAKLWVDRHDTLFHALNLYHPYSRVGRLATRIAGFMPRSWVLHGAPSLPDRLRFKHLSNIIHRNCTGKPTRSGYRLCKNRIHPQRRRRASAPRGLVSAPHGVRYHRSGNAPARTRLPDGSGKHSFVFEPG